ncbi:hypothetical protein SuNHUV7_38420 (plasmid) [Pseudoseohaeicola sp. NH-UV-7]|uniref:FecR family protein n=1 Tax=unclassified Sulfitobacter TaxID=196795 RepID=UPI000E0A3BA8|nr:FecR family protein [Sulfitobacter sp. JL08]AXI54313.1 iron dicitrate transport regulator FecR [Sulfitobacter sp. JL08]
MRAHRIFKALFAAGCVVYLSSPAALAQMEAHCLLGQASDPDRQVFTCSGGLVIELEAAAQMGFTTGDSDADTLDLTGGAALIEVTPGGFAPQIRTPHAIAAVRGTVYAVDVTDTGTSVFVVRGQVDVGALSDQEAPVVLGPGDGVDVTPGETLEVKSWGAARVAALLARFGR